MGVERPQYGIPVETPIPLGAGVAACLVRAGVGGKVRRRRAATKPPCASDGRGGASAGVARDCHRAASRQAPPRAGNAVGGRERAPPTPPMASDPEPPPRGAAAQTRRRQPRILLAGWSVRPLRARAGGGGRATGAHVSCPRGDTARSLVAHCRGGQERKPANPPASAAVATDTAPRGGRPPPATDHPRLPVWRRGPRRYPSAAALFRPRPASS